MKIFRIMKTVEINQSFAYPVEQLYDYLKVHENLPAVFGPLTIKTVREGSDSRYGTGSVRELSLAGIAPFEETVTEAIPNELIRYKITKGSPLRDHEGIMRFSSNGSGSKLHYTITFDSDIPLVADIVRLILQTAISTGLKKLKL